MAKETNHKSPKCEKNIKICQSCGNQFVAEKDEKFCYGCTHQTK